MARSRKNKSTSRSVDFSKAGKPFEKETAYHLVVKEASWQEGNAGDYIAIEFQGVDEYENSTIYHNASIAPKALPRTRAMLEAMGYEISEDGDTSIDVSELVGLEVMGETYEDRYEGGKNIKVDDFYPVEGKSKGKKGGGKDKKSDDLDLSDVDEDDLKKLAKKLKVKGAAKMDEDDLREALGDLDESDVREAAEALDIDLDGGSDDNGAGDFDLDDLDEDDLKKLAKKLKVKGAAKMDEDDLKEALGDIDEDALTEAAEELGLIEGDDKKDDGKKGKSKGGYAESDVSEMSEEELEKVIKKHKLDVDLDDFKTLRKKQNATIDALESEGLIES